MSAIDRELYAYLYTCGKLTLKDLFDMVTKDEIDHHDFHWITGLSYYGIKKEWGW